MPRTMLSFPLEQFRKIEMRIEMDEFIKIPVGWFSHPKNLELMSTDPANPYRWLYTLAMAKLLDRNGVLEMFDGTPVGASFLANGHDRDAKGWEKFLQLALDLELLKGERGSTLLIADSWMDAIEVRG